MRPRRVDRVDHSVEQGAAADDEGRLVRPGQPPGLTAGQHDRVVHVLDGIRRRCP